MEQIPTTYLGVFYVLLVGLLGLLGEMIRRQSNTLYNHLSSVAKSLALVEERLARIDRRDEALIVDLVKSALMVPPGTRVVMEPVAHASKETSTP